MNLIRTSLLMLLALALSACEDETLKLKQTKPTANGAYYSESLAADMPNGCSLYFYRVVPPGAPYSSEGRYVLCDNGQQTGSTHKRSCGKSTCQEDTAVIGDPVAIKRAAAYSKLSEEERQLLGVK